MRLGVCGPIDTRALVPYLGAGVERMPAGMGGTPVNALVRAAVERGWQVTVFTLDGSVEQEYIVAGPRLKICIGPYRRRHRARDLFRAERRYLSCAIAREQPDVVHAHWTYEFALAALDSGCPALITAHDRPLRILRWDGSPYRLVRTAMAGMVAYRARWLTAVSDGVAAHLYRWFHTRAPIDVIPNGLEPEWFEERGAVAPAAGFTFLSVLSGWGPLKNASTLLEAFALVRASLPGTRLLLFGSGHGPGEEAERWAHARNLSAGVDFLGHLPRFELRRRMRCAHVLVHPSREESYSMPVAEAMASGVPVIAAHGSGGIAESLDGGQDALLTDCSSAVPLAAGMLELARNPDRRLELAQRARVAACAHFPIERVLASYEGLYRRLRGA